ncbi:ATP synthase subunit I [[Phormidium] sp. ETS-05]|uniref:ATP synthase subunit I n=1 Tax=[Phormidium] sp. ETS-05 TaxID=222819 RepID=UPI0031FEE428
MNPPNPSEQPRQDEVGDIAPSDAPASETNASLQEFYQLQQRLFVYTLVMTAVIFASVWIGYDLHIAINYLLGACVGVVYLRMLARDVERIGQGERKLVPSRLALFIGLIIVATQWDQLEIVPIFLGFLTYKAAIVVYMLQTTLLPESK